LIYVPKKFGPKILIQKKCQIQTFFSPKNIDLKKIGYNTLNTKYLRQFRRIFIYFPRIKKICMKNIMGFSHI